MLAPYLTSRARQLLPHHALASVMIALPLPGHRHASVRIGWSGMTGDPDAAPAVPAGVAVSVLSSLDPDRVRIDGGDPVQIETDVVELAWRLGAWDVSRWVFAPGSPPGDAFDHPADSAAAAAGGYVAWMFKPVHLGPALRRRDDSSLLPDGTRDPAALVLPQVQPIRPGRQIVIRLGRPDLAAPPGRMGRPWRGRSGARGVGRHPGDGKALVVAGSVAVGETLPADDPRRLATPIAGGAVVVKLSKPFPARGPSDVGQTLQFAYLGDLAR